MDALDVFGKVIAGSREECVECDAIVARAARRIRENGGISRRRQRARERQISRAPVVPPPDA